MHSKKSAKKMFSGWWYGAPNKQYRILYWPTSPSCKVFLLLWSNSLTGSLFRRKKLRVKMALLNPEYCPVCTKYEERKSYLQKRVPKNNWPAHLRKVRCTAHKMPVSCSLY
jgi:hypothetical protein